jgi:hypothetical protein
MRSLRQQARACRLEAAGDTFNAMKRNRKALGGNVGVTFAYRIADGVASGIWSSVVLSTYVYVLMGGGDAANAVRLFVLDR